MYRGVASVYSPAEWSPQTISSGVLDERNVLPQGIWNGGRSSSSSSQVSLSSSPSEREGRHRRRRVGQLGMPLEAMGECGVQGPFVSQMATLARCCEAVPWYCEAVPKRQDELGAIIGPKKHQRGVLCPIEGRWGPILPFGSCRLGHF